MKKNFIAALLILLVSAVMMLNGCGGGGSGRQVLPGENPLGPVDIADTTGSGGTGGTSGAGGTSGTGSAGGTTGGIGAQPGKPADVLNAADANMKIGSYDVAMNKYREIISGDTANEPEPEELAQAYNGLGWAQTKQYGTKEGLDNFKKAIDKSKEMGKEHLDSLLGYAMGLIQTSNKNNVKEAIKILEQIGLGNPTYELETEHKWVGISSADAHAMLAYAYYFAGGTAASTASATKQINAAYAAAPTSDVVITVKKIIELNAR